MPRVSDCLAPTRIHASLGLTPAAQSLSPCLPSLTPRSRSSHIFVAFVRCICPLHLSVAFIRCIYSVAEIFMTDLCFEGDAETRVRRAYRKKCDTHTHARADMHAHTHTHTHTHAHTPVCSARRPSLPRCACAKSRWKCGRSRPTSACVRKGLLMPLRNS